MNSLKLCRALGLSPDQLFQRAGFLPAEGDTERDRGAVGDDEQESGAQCDKRRVELERKAQVDLERVLRMDERNREGV